VLVAGYESPIVRELASKSFAPVASFGITADAPMGEHAARPGTTAVITPTGSAAATVAPATLQWAARDVEYGVATTRFTVEHAGTPWGQVETPLAGAYNVRNCLAAIAAAHAMGADPEKVREAMRSFRSVRRRMELKGEVGGVTVIDDFAHHPTAVQETLQAARQRYGGRRLVAVFEPRSYTAQRREFQEPYTRALAFADEIVLGGLYHPERYTKETALDPDMVIAALRATGRTASYIPDVDAIVRQLAATTQPGDVVVIMSNGGFGGIHGKLLKSLNSVERR
ncbi:MAG: glutamate ligase domain-containing protein, partial [Longimicrobiales bacterium]